MKYLLNSKDNSLLESAEIEANSIIQRMLDDLEEWQDRYERLGAKSAAAKEAFSQEAARWLGVTKIQPDWYLVEGKWHRCYTDPDGTRYVDGKKHLL